MKPYSSLSDGLFEPMFGAPAVSSGTDANAWLAAMLEVERALAAAGAACGVIPESAAAAIQSAADPARFDVASIAYDAAQSGTPVIALVRELTAAVPPDARPYVHFGATSQDIIDTAASLIAYRCLGPVLDDVAEAADVCARLAAEHRDTILIGRTVMRHASPATFGLVCAGWLTALDDAYGRLDYIRRHRLAAQLGGAAGTLAGLNLGVPAAFAASLGLADPVLPWHTDRTRMAELAGALGTLAGVLGKIAHDVLLHSQPEVGELETAGADTAGSSAMPHKRNPVQAVAVTANSIRVPGLVATMLAAMVQEHQRAAGAWQAEWETLTALLRATGGAAHHGRALVEGLTVNLERMRANVELSGGMAMSAAVADRLAPVLGRTAAHDLIRRIATEAARNGIGLGAALRADSQVREVLTDADIDAALNPANGLGLAAELVDRAVAAHPRRAR